MGNKQTQYAAGWCSSRADSECHALAEAEKACSGMAGPTGMQQARDSVLGNASSGLLEEEGRQGTVTNGLREDRNPRLAG